VKYGEITINGNSYRLIAYGYCSCGCERLAPIAKNNDKMRGRIKGQPQRFIRGHNANKNGICPECKIRKRAITKMGRQASYCHQCHNKQERFRYKKRDENQQFRFCECCLQPFITAPYHPNQKYCSENCMKYDWARRNLEKTRQSKQKYSEKHPYVPQTYCVVHFKQCLVCQKWFATQKRNGKYCSSQCAGRHTYNITKFERSSSACLVYFRKCSICKEWFTSQKPQATACSKACRSKHDRVMLRDHYVRQNLQSKTIFKNRDIPQNLIDYCRENLKLKRKLHKTNLKENPC
jgi:hypothetical protein